MKNKINNIGFGELTVQTYLSVSRPLFLFYIALAAAVFIHWLFWVPALILVLDVRARMSDFIRFRRLPYSEKMLNLLEKSWCKRGVAQAIWPEATPIYYAKGFRLYHVLPVGSPQVFFKLRFWEAVIGTKNPDKNHNHW